MESFANDLDHDEINGNQKFADNMKMEKRCSKQTLRNILTFSIIWISYYFINAGFSMLGPFFPQEVNLFVNFLSYMHIIYRLLSLVFRSC